MLLTGSRYLELPPTIFNLRYIFIFMVEMLFMITCRIRTRRRLFFVASNQQNEGRWYHRLCSLKAELHL